MIELLVVMLIISILLAIAVPTYLGARRSAKERVVVAAAASYRNAIEGFRLDHGTRVPVMGDADDWPILNPLDGPARQYERGPVDQFGKPYMRNAAPEALTTGIAALGDASVVADSSMTGRIIYEPGPGTPATTYRLRVEVRDGDDWKTACEIGNIAGLDDSC
jgi:type II secretory pathway pseudopilin PulG